jgi:Zn-finger nucleic acid-binding protein
MKCPKCEENMEQIHTIYADYDRCTFCKGLWLDMHEHIDLKPIAYEVDIGDPEIGRKFNERQDIYCPVCSNIKMLRLVDPRQPHIWFESCHICFGRFYDAGEFKDFAEEGTFLDFIKMMVAKERK